jgi:hypothetical protein
MPATPFLTYGKVYDTDGTTAISNAYVLCKNVTNNESQSQLSDSSGDYSFDLANFTSGYSTGDEISLFVSYGSYYVEVVFTVSGAGKEQDLTLDTLIESKAVYCTVSDVRNYTGVGSAEYSDAAIYDFIKRTTNKIDELTGRTWKGTQTVTNEYYDGDDTDLLWMNNTDLQSVTAVSIDDNLDGTYTTITVTRVHVYNEGYIVLDRNAEITSFVSGPKTIKVSYTYGNSEPSELVRELAVLIVANMMRNDPVRAENIDRIFEKVRWLGPRGLA